MCFTGDRIRLHVGGVHQLSIHTINAHWCAAAVAPLSWELRFSEQEKHLNKLLVSLGCGKKNKNWPIRRGNHSRRYSRERVSALVVFEHWSEKCWPTSMRIQLRIQTAQPETIWFTHNFPLQIIKKKKLKHHCEGKSVPSVCSVTRYTSKSVSCSIIYNGSVR